MTTTATQTKICHIEVAPGINVLVRDWLHSNTVLLPGARPAIVDTGYHTGTAALMAAIEAHAGFAVADIETIALTHVHSDHAGGCAALQSASQARILAHPDCRALVEEWHPRRLWLEGFGQEMPRFGIGDGDVLTPGERWTTNGIEWHIIDTPGHAIGGIGLYAPRHKVLISGDALWHDGFGVLYLALEGDGVIDLAERALDNLDALDVDVVIPGHGEPFGDYRAALARARRRLRSYRDDLERTLARDLRAMVAFWLLVNDGAPRAELQAALHGLLAAEARLRVPDQSIEDTVEALMAGLVATQVMTETGDRVHLGARLL